MTARHCIGLDFGTTNSIIAMMENGQPVAFKYGPPGQQEEYIPSFVTYEEPEGEPVVEIGSAARTIALNHRDCRGYSHFKMQLPQPVFLASQPDPAQLTRDYLRELLLSPQNPQSFTQQKGEIVRLVVSVPEIWQRDIYNLGRERLQRILREDLALGDRLLQLVSEPVAAAAYYAWTVQQQGGEAFAGNLLVCDMGGGTFDVSLCRVDRNCKVEVLYFDGQGDRGLEVAGVAFDRACVQIAYQKQHSHPLAETDPQFPRLLREFEAVKLSRHRAATQALTTFLKAPEDLAERQVYVFGEGYTLTCQDVARAFAPIARGIQQVMQRVQTVLQEQGQLIDRLFLVGGFCQFLLVQQAILTGLGMDGQDPRWDRRFSNTSTAYGIAYGACLIANGLVDPIERYLHTLGIVVDTINARAERSRRFVPIIRGGMTLDELHSPQFADIPPLVTFQSDGPLTITLGVMLQSQFPLLTEVLPNMIKLPTYAPDAQWRVGMRVNLSQVAYLIIQEISTGQQVEYELGNVLAQMFPGFVLRELAEDARQAS